ncbi:MAG TPA: hypothetical protein VG916_05790 [Gemmatimonadaceae bacterium]|nr:hypothetical protein [Gemmatimonadaceae bacterium]
MNKLIGCKAASAALLPQRWREATADTAELRALIALSAAVRDRRILAAVRATALAKDRPAVVRGAAVTVLGSYVYPTLSGRVKQNRDGTIEVMVGPRTNPYQEEGLQPLGLDEQIEIDRVLNQLTSDFKSGDVPYLARGILNTVRAACHDPKSRESVARCP